AIGMMMAADKEKIVMTRLDWNCEIVSSLASVGNMGTSIEFPRTSTNGTVDKAIYSHALFLRPPLFFDEVDLVCGFVVMSLVKVTDRFGFDFVVVDKQAPPHGTCDGT